VRWLCSCSCVLDCVFEELVRWLRFCLCVLVRVCGRSLCAGCAFVHACLYVCVDGACALAVLLFMRLSVCGRSLCAGCAFVHALECVCLCLYMLTDMTW